MEVGCLRDSLYADITAMQKEIQILQRQDMLLALEIVALKKLIGATPTEVALAAADPVVRTHKFGFAVDNEEDGNGT